MNEEQIKELIKASIDAGRRTMVRDFQRAGILEPGNGWDEEALELYYPFPETYVNDIYLSLTSGEKGWVTVVPFGSHAE